MTTPKKRSWTSPNAWLQFFFLVSCIGIVGFFITGTINGAIVFMVLFTVMGLFGILYT